MKLKDFFTCVLTIILVECAGLIGSFFTVSAIPTWYANLSKPALNPPSVIFGPVWTTLYALMGIAAFLVWKKRNDPKKTQSVKIALWVFFGQLVLNTFWSIIFFGAKNLGGALIELTALWFSILATIFLFWKISKTAAWLLIPYILWVTFAGYLNYMLWAMN